MSTLTRMTNRRTTGVCGAVVLVAIFGIGKNGEAAEVRCTAGDVACIAAAINDANAMGEPTVVWLDSGRYILQQPLPTITGTVILRGVHEQTTILERGVGAPPMRILTVAGGDLTVSSLTITLGSPGLGEPGGGILASGTLTVTRSIITRNIASFAPGGAGGGISFSGGRLTITESSITQNTAPSGGGLDLGLGQAVIRDSTISGNGVLSFSGFSGQIQTGSVAGSPPAQNTVIISRTTIVGRGLHTVIDATHSVTFTDTTIAGSGSQSVFNGGTVTLVGSTVIGGLFNTGTARLRNTILGSCLGSGVAPVSEGHNLIAPDCAIGLAAGDVVGEAGVGAFTDGGVPGRGFFPLLPDSLAVDAGDDASCMAADQLGLPRGADGNDDGVRRCDIGATEFYPVINDALRLESLTGVYLPPGNEPLPDGVAPGGRYVVTALFTNVSGRSLCDISVRIVTVQGASGQPAFVLGPPGAVLHGAGSVIPGAHDIEPLGQESFSFVIGLTQKAPFTFLVTFMGELFSGACR